MSNWDHLNSNSASTNTSDLAILRDPAGNLSIHNLDSSKIGSTSRAGVPSRGLHSIAGLKSKEIDLSGSGDSAGESSVGSGESECQLTSGVLGFVDEGDVKGEEGVDVVV